jgi:hypothetical protein
MVGKAKRERAPKPLPICKAILLCTKITHDPQLHTTSVIGIFDTIQCESFPLIINRVFIFIFLDEVIGECALSAKIVDLTEDVVVAHSSIPKRIGVPGDRISGERWLPINGVVFNHSGTYDLVVLVDGRELDRAPFKVMTHGERGEEMEGQGRA